MILYVRTNKQIDKFTWYLEGILNSCKVDKICLANLNALILSACFDNEYSIALYSIHTIKQFFFF